MSEEIRISSDKLEVRLDKELLSLQVMDRQHGHVWEAKQLFSIDYGGRPGMPLTPGHCRSEVECAGDAIIIRLHSFRYWARWPEHYYNRPENGPDLNITLEMKLSGNMVRFTVQPVRNIGAEDIKVLFPYRLGEFSAKESGELILPYGAGTRITFPRRQTIDREDMIYGGPLSMPFFGMTCGRKSLLGIVNTPYDCCLQIRANRLYDRSASVTAGFLFEDDRLNYARSTDYFFLTDAGYVEMAKIYRKRLQDEGRFVSLQEKIDRNPEVEKLVGTVVWKHNVFCRRRPDGMKKDCSLYVWEPSQAVLEGRPANWTVEELFGEAKARGFDRLTVYNTGWNIGGYDSMYPTKFSPDPARGSEADFKDMASWARSLSDGYIYSIHDNYSDAYKNSPEWDSGCIVKGRNGELSQGEVWRGGRAYHICPLEAGRFLERDLPRVAAMLGRGSIYIDVFGNLPLHECFDERHPLTRSEDACQRKRLLEQAKEYIGSIATECWPFDFLADTVDLGAFFPIHAPYLFEDIELPLPLPLYQLVYHDSVLNYTTESIYGYYGTEYLLYAALYNLLPFSLEDISLKLSRELRDTYKAEMVEHRFLTENRARVTKNKGYQTRGVQQTVYSDGMEVVANFGSEGYLYGKEEIKARSFGAFKGGKRLI